ncbi:uncharacterized protein SPPG_07860 [Spizellomyces punctatus DAOM BR117]|uniref:Histone deacetylase 8 n=1 Tax=Spizellomyces punctatus (strain DAOM BR117) TaxID=645134 RepID=A0A0L0H617_SPIPD|nr:uncharacterized protein SPPG_07860 [Spizellomyces punctatus DAOM BR117]KNC96647.1 hypothetical protein SPPG_07860 [Spizellomyces punctatus DAOM BR117]|eukprot:XP_016604687.1 hypothetical protein SPPG_07860 [Spizellomyces punctatus DAOM BR117]
MRYWDLGQNIEVHLITLMFRILQPAFASKEDLMVFHTEEYIDFLLNAEAADPESDEYLESIARFGLQYDCPVFNGLSSYVAGVAGGTLEAARALVDGDVDIAIHWDGGRHHAHREQASGFCYVNDIVLGMSKLQTRFQRILYLDIDIHHGDGVEGAYLFSPRVYTCSFHRSGVFFPITGASTTIGSGKARYHNLNIPLHRGLRGALFLACFQQIVQAICAVYDPQCIVLQGGADGAAGNLNTPEVDENGRRKEDGEGWKLDPATFGKIVSFLCNLRSPTVRPLLILGGGGYVNTITARCWAMATAAAIPVELLEDIPEHALWTEYCNEAPLGLASDENPKYIDDIMKTALESIRRLAELKGIQL